MFSFPSLIVSWLFERHKSGSERGVPIISYIVIYERAREAIGRAKRAIETGRKTRGSSKHESWQCERGFVTLWLGRGKLNG